MSKIDTLKAKLEKKRKFLEELETARIEIISTGKSYSIQNGDDRRQLENVSLKDVNDLINKTESEITTLENQIDRGGVTGSVVLIGARW